ncbi:MAG TPA: nucleotidyltransferase family protein [Thermoanaerobaculia bacterium]|nr:nucleotidyltransferase family protein [Thermoanaerobaculia bacterium]
MGDDGERMMARRFRFQPPALAMTAELRWVLLRAFAPVGDAATFPVDLAAAVALARRLGLSARIGARIRPAAELAGAAASDAALAHDTVAAAVAQMQGREAAGEIADAAAEVALGCCFLKGVALEAMGLLSGGSRPLGDVDVLVPAAAAATLESVLLRRGFARASGEEYPHHLAPLLHPRLGAVEIHRHLPGVALPEARRFADFDGLAAAGWLECWPAGGAAAWLPRRPLLVAHLLAHALAQHGFRPGAYPAMRVLADLIDLGLADETGVELIESALALVARWVPPAEARAARAVCGALVRGEVSLLSDDGEPALLLRHLVAGTLDERYAEALKLQELSYPVSDRSRVGGWLAVGWQAVALSRAQIDRIYGKPRHPWGYLGRWLLRPFDLARRGARALRRR